MPIDSKLGQNVSRHHCFAIGTSAAISVIKIAARVVHRIKILFVAPTFALRENLQIFDCFFTQHNLLAAIACRTLAGGCPKWNLPQNLHRYAVNPKCPARRLAISAISSVSWRTLPAQALRRNLRLLAIKN